MRNFKAIIQLDDLTGDNTLQNLELALRALKIEYSMPDNREDGHIVLNVFYPQSARK